MPLRWAVLDSTPVARRDLRQLLMLALGLLGESVPYEMAVTDPSQAEDTAAYLLAQVLSDTNADRLARVTMQVLAGATSREARRVASEADRLIGSGMLLSVVG